MQPSCTVFHRARSRKHGRRHVKPTHIPWSWRLHFARCFLVSMIDRRPDPRRIQQLHVDGMALDNRARKDHARATTRRVCTALTVPVPVGRYRRAPAEARATQNVIQLVVGAESLGYPYTSHVQVTSTIFTCHRLYRHQCEVRLCDPCAPCPSDIERRRHTHTHSHSHKHFTGKVFFPTPEDTGPAYTHR